MLLFKKIQLACELGLPIGIPLLNCSRIAQKLRGIYQGSQLCTQVKLIYLNVGNLHETIVLYQIHLISKYSLYVVLL